MSQGFLFRFAFTVTWTGFSFRIMGGSGSNYSECKYWLLYYQILRLASQVRPSRRLLGAQRPSSHAPNDLQSIILHIGTQVPPPPQRTCGVHYRTALGSRQRFGDQLGIVTAVALQGELYATRSSVGGCDPGTC